MAADTLTLGLDFGTSAVKAIVMNADGTVCSAASAAYETKRPAADHAEQDPEAWWQALRAVCRAVMADIDGATIGAIGLSGQLNGIVLIGADGKVLRPSLIWLDQRCTEQVRALEDEHSARLAAATS
ncbi:MAG: xylulokinase, partial [Proteobacteria bacterium]|nr:xylulokinase [Pseudomonadota bacterium]